MLSHAAMHQGMLALMNAVNPLPFFRFKWDRYVVPWSVFTKPEFAQADNMSSIVRLLEDGRALREFIREATEDGLIVTIGKENRFDQIINCSLVTSTYRVGKITGRIGIIGPTRMEYSKLVSLVDYTARTITDMLSGMDKDEGAAK